ncbi:UvrD-helicase domain-containing protein [Microvirga brassicacearum]|uniref:DNA 3'-5' helicase n=1 Tax=Microvirga brassicacearum TaxID=2580413 RepID=A0A5N3PC45_9HYPH|nr:UvrD-helicase domain-containing protein [Microvirga brassicacearum]KAB0267264.1 DNA helicase UvrD [Microvirga brassicacearum]
MLKRARTYRPGLFARLFSGENWKLTPGRRSTAGICLASGGGETELECLDLESVQTAKGVLWHAVEIRSRTRMDRLSGLGRSAADELAADLVGFVNEYLGELIRSETNQLREIDARLGAVVTDNYRYLAHSDLGSAIAGVPGKAATAFSHPMFDPRRMAQTLEAALPASYSFLTDPNVRHHYNERFVVAELAAFAAFFDDLDGRSLSGQQREACIRLEDSNLLIASAGSGKSATMVGKVAYVLEKKLVRPDEILVLAFNKNAADELRERIARQLKVEPDKLQCRVTTFHALGRGIIQEVDGRPPQLANWVEHPAGEAKAIEEIIVELASSDREFMRLWVDLLVVHPKADIPRETFDSEVDYQRYVTERRTKGKATIGSLAGIYVKSLQEQSIANWLWLNSVAFEYERQVQVRDAEGAVRHIHPDFYYLATGTVHEHFAIDANGASPFKDYVDHAEAKRRDYQVGQKDFFETRSAQAADGTIFDVMRKQLEGRGIPLVAKQYSEIAKALEPVVVKHYHQLIGTCIKHIRANHLTLDILLERAQSLHDRERARIFSRVVYRIAEAYSQKLVDAGRIDFDSMIADATQLVETKRYTSPYSLILVDEFQDISGPRAKLIKSLRDQKPFSKLFAVGDDWQSIYRFAGSDVTLFTRFEANFGTSWQGRLEQTYRCNQLIAETAAGFVQRNPEQLRKLVRSIRPAIPKSIRVIPIEGTKERPDFGAACLRLLSRLDVFLGSIAEQWRGTGRQKLKALVLWRYNHLDPFAGRMPAFAHFEVSALSFHRSKGLEADYTILLDISEGDYGVPSRVEDDELLNLVIPNPETFAYAEERRLFYVALTRASRGVFLLADGARPSRYIQELCEVAGEEIRFETIDGQALQQCPACRVGQLVERKTKTGRSFVGCSQYPNCRHVVFSGKQKQIRSRALRRPTVQ